MIQELRPLISPTNSRPDTEQLRRQNVQQPPKYIIERNFPDVGSLKREQLAGVTARFNETLARLGSDIHWIESYVAADAAFCVCPAEIEDMIREHAEVVDFRP